MTEVTDVGNDRLKPGKPISKQLVREAEKRRRHR